MSTPSERLPRSKGKRLRAVLCSALALLILCFVSTLLLVRDYSPLICKSTGLRMDCWSYSVFGVRLWERSYGPFANPLSEFLGRPLRVDNAWVPLPLHARWLTDPRCRLVIDAGLDEAAWARPLLRRFVLDPQNSVEEAIGVGMASQLRQRGAIDWGAWRRFAESRGVNVDGIIHEWSPGPPAGEALREGASSTKARVNSADEGR